MISAELEICQLECDSFVNWGGIQLTSLKSLTLKELGSSYTSTAHLSPSILPSLRNLALPDQSMQHILFARVHYPNFFRLLAQLETLYLEHYIVSPATLDSLRPVFSKTLITFNPPGGPLSHRLRPTEAALNERFKILVGNIQHLKIANEALEYLDAFARIVNDEKNLALRTVYLKDNDRKNPIESLVQTLVEICHKRGVEVIYEKPSMFWGVDPAMSPSFISKQQKIRAVEGEAQRN